MKANIKLELKTLTPVRLAELMGVVATRMEGNMHFPAPPVSPAELEALKVNLTQAILAAIDGSKQSRLQRDALVPDARARLRYVADYVRMVAQGNAAILASSGFQLAKEPGAPQMIGTPLIKEVRMTGRHGEVELRWTGVPNRGAYHVYITEVEPTQPDAPWDMIGVTGKVTHRIQGLEPYKVYWFCVSATGALGEGMKSTPAMGRAA
jgi:hypothetical protein